MSKDPRPSPADTTAIADLSYEDARDELVQIVARIEGGGASLEESMKLWERGESLAAHCQAKLDQAQAQLDGTTAEPDPAGPTTTDSSDESDPDVVGGPKDDSDDDLEDGAAEPSDV
ncbi:exodeoxyribonuclease VII small subunit [Ornithinimicrobium cryptoxanthini]|uniref:exodeoxyribonuclease VII small subunit n=1 Tax=Ornithinimicrobium cryptoxanthini TaxID=2934161 RepID=UPI0021187399|nr:exodeoxyribonuclease VII small subunit [Ornithinimicrobium cryptoxanthini]